MKQCATCDQEKPLSDFYTQKSGKHNGKPTSECKECCRIRSKAYYAANKERSRMAHLQWADNNRDRVAFHKAKSAYGISQEQYDTLPQICTICGSQERLRIDHSHQNGQIRGRLCDGCNKGLGFFRDDPTLLSRAADYILGVTKPDIFAASYEAVEE